jgi:hypothetical protein
VTLSDAGFGCHLHYGFLQRGLSNFVTAIQLLGFVC